MADNAGRTWRFPAGCQPYAQQVELMDAMYQVMCRGEVGVMESPTGTGKSLSVICASMRWLTESLHGQQQQQQQQQHAENRKHISAPEPDWIQAFEHAHESKKAAASVSRVARQRQKATLRFGKRHRNDSGGLGPQVDEDPDACLSESSHSSSRFDREGLHGVTQDIPTRPRVVYCTRTHSQIRQFVSEYKRTPYASVGTSQQAVGDMPVLLVPLGSRKHLCTNPQVERLGYASAINEACRDLTQGSSISSSQELPRHDKKKGTKTPTRGCPMYRAGRIQACSDALLQRPHDLEELHMLARSREACGYFSARAAVAELGADLVVAPYAAVLHRETRLALGLSLRGAVVIFDEAHNLVDAVNDMYSASLTADQISTVQKSLEAYLARYSDRLSTQHLFLTQQYLKFVLCIQKFMQAGISSTPGASAERINAEEKVMAPTDFSFEAGIEQINLFQLHEHVVAFKLSFKLCGFVEGLEAKEAELDTGSNEARNESSGAKRGAIFAAAQFLDALKNPVKNGRIQHIAATPGKALPAVLRFVLLNPEEHFRAVVKEAHAVLLVGGTLSPKRYLLARLGLSREPDIVVKEHTCDHVIPAENLFARVVGAGPSGSELRFTFENRSLPHVMDELGRAVTNLARLTPGGLILFFGSYAYAAQVVAYWTRSGHLTRMKMLKPIFCEEKSTPAEKTLSDFRDAVDADAMRGALLCAVMGGKLSEGINFGDAYGRAVCVVGMPFPNPHDALQRELIHHLTATLGAETAKEFPEDVCMKTVNQTLGRVIRHASDFAAIFLIDARYTQRSVQAKLPRWLQRSLSSSRQPGRAAENSFGALPPQLIAFFRARRGGGSQ